MLILPIKKKWFDMIRTGEKKEEYRDIKPYYDSRLLTYFGKFWVGSELVSGKGFPEIERPEIREVIFRNGYSGTSPEIVCKCSLETGTGKAEWGAEPGKKYYILKIHSIDERIR